MHKHNIDREAKNQPECPRSPAAADLMQFMVAGHAAFGVPNKTSMMDLGPSEEMAELCKLGYAQELPASPDHYQLTSAGMRCVTNAEKAEYSGNALTYPLKNRKPVPEMSKWELIVQLADEGWEEKECSGAVDPHEPGPGAEKIYFYKERDPNLPKPYLVCLCTVETLFQNGLEKLWHFQPNAYYNALMSLLEFGSTQMHFRNLLPNQPRVYYQDFVHRAEQGLDWRQPDSTNSSALNSRKRKAMADTDTNAEMDLEPEQGLTVQSSRSQPSMPVRKIVTAAAATAKPLRRKPVTKRKSKPTTAATTRNSRNSSESSSASTSTSFGSEIDEEPKAQQSSEAKQPPSSVSSSNMQSTPLQRLLAERRKQQLLPADDRSSQPGPHSKQAASKPQLPPQPPEPTNSGGGGNTGVSCSTSFLAGSTIWFGNIPLMRRSDQGGVSRQQKRKSCHLFNHRSRSRSSYYILLLVAVHCVHFNHTLKFIEASNLNLL